MLRDITRFNHDAVAGCSARHAGSTLGQLLAAERFPRKFRDHYLIAMGAAIG